MLRTIILFALALLACVGNAHADSTSMRIWTPSSQQQLQAIIAEKMGDFFDDNNMTYKIHNTNSTAVGKTNGMLCKFVRDSDPDGINGKNALLRFGEGFGDGDLTGKASDDCMFMHYMFEMTPERIYEYIFLKRILPAIVTQGAIDSTQIDLIRADFIKKYNIPGSFNTPFRDKMLAIIGNLNMASYERPEGQSWIIQGTAAVSQLTSQFELKKGTDIKKFINANSGQLASAMWNDPLLATSNFRPDGQEELDQVVEPPATGMDPNAKPTFVDGACTASVGQMGESRVLVQPKLFDLKQKLTKEFSKFFVFNSYITNINGLGFCDLSEPSCVVANYGNSLAVTADMIYDAVIKNVLYSYVKKSTVDNNAIELIRSDFIKKQKTTVRSDIDMRQFDIVMKEMIVSVGMTSTTPGATWTPGTRSNAFQSKFNNMSVAQLNTEIDVMVTKIAEKMLMDPLFYNQAVTNENSSSLVAFPVTSRLMECLDGTFRNLFTKDISATMPRTPFGIAQDYFKPAVILALILYFIFYGYQIVMAHGMGKQSEIIMFAVKFGLVFYFSIGEAWKDFAFDMLKSIPATVAQIVFEALPGAADGCSAYKPYMYPQGKGMLAFFDTIDCKYANYMGISPTSSYPAIFSVITLPMLIPIPIVGTLVSGVAILYVGVVTFGILVAVEIYISAILFLTFYLFLSPLIVPMALFSKTKGICEKYQTKIMGTVVQAVMAVIMMVTVIGLMDGVLYGPSPEKVQMFTPSPQPMVNGVPQPNVLNKECYPDSAAGFINDTPVMENGKYVYVKNKNGVEEIKKEKVGAIMGFAVPVPCILAKIKEPAWYAFPVPYILELFDLPVSSSFKEIFFCFLIPAVCTIITLLIIQTVTGQMSGVIDKISGATSVSSFGAASFNGGKAAMDLAKKAVDEAKQAASAVSDAYKAVSRKGSESKEDDAGEKK